MSIDLQGGSEDPLSHCSVCGHFAAQHLSEKRVLYH